MAKKEKPETGQMTVKGLNRIVQVTHAAAAKSAKEIQKAINQAGLGSRYNVVAAGEKSKVKAFKFAKPKQGRVSPE